MHGIAVRWYMQIGAPLEERHKTYWMMAFKGYVDVQLIELEELQNDATPNFVEKVLTLFYKDSARLIHNIDHSLIVKYLSKTKVRIRLLHCERYVVVWWSIGAKKVKTECTQFMEYCLAGNVEGHY
ncbi:hypothetical protein KY290_019249 [Solanum tuberosum]|uniref:Histidine-containing phosphotransfer protein n=1 Tax=Solanum tuberosum TaxID=4113 RepID=A0ABQ7VIC2_SOLTU|nr:hypothetical protein KY290_019249 [Solanum tuberosum]